MVKFIDHLNKKNELESTYPSCWISSFFGPIPRLSDSFHSDETPSGVATLIRGEPHPLQTERSPTTQPPLATPLKCRDPKKTEEES